MLHLSARMSVSYLQTASYTAAPAGGMQTTLDKAKKLFTEKKYQDVITHLDNNRHYKSESDYQFHYVREQKIRTDFYAKCYSVPSGC